MAAKTTIGVLLILVGAVGVILGALIAGSGPAEVRPDDAIFDDGSEAAGPAVRITGWMLAAVGLVSFLTGILLTVRARRRMRATA